RRDMRSHTPPESDFGSVVFGANRLPNKPLPDELESLADATRAVLPVGSCGGVAGGLAWAGIVPGSGTAGDRTTPEASEYGLWKAAMNLGCMPPSVRVTTGTVAVPRRTYSAISRSSLCCFSATAATSSSLTL